MEPTSDAASRATSAEEASLRDLYARLLGAWNAQDGDAFAACFAPDGTSIGFDGSTIEGQAEIRTHLRTIFADHQTGRYVVKVRAVRALAEDVALLRAVSGMIPAGQSTVAPQVNALQTLLATRQDDAWRIILFQNTPAQFHGRPELAQQLTEELQALV